MRSPDRMYSMMHPGSWEQPAYQTAWINQGSLFSPSHCLQTCRIRFPFSAPGPQLHKSQNIPVTVSSTNKLHSGHQDSLSGPFQSQSKYPSHESIPWDSMLSLLTLNTQPIPPSLALIRMDIKSGLHFHCAFTASPPSAITPPGWSREKDDGAKWAHKLPDWCSYDPVWWPREAPTLGWGGRTKAFSPRVYDSFPW